MTRTLYEIAHARTGDKGNISNISLIAYKPEDYEILVMIELWLKTKKTFYAPINSL